MKNKKIIIAGLTFLFIAVLVFADTLFEKPTPKYNITDTYNFNLDGDSMICFKVKGYEGTNPCFNSTELVFDRGELTTESLITIHNRMDNINEVNAINKERETIKGKVCLLDLNCDGVYIKSEFICNNFKCISKQEAETSLQLDAKSLIGKTI